MAFGRTRPSLPCYLYTKASWSWMPASCWPCPSWLWSTVALPLPQLLHPQVPAGTEPREADQGPLRPSVQARPR